MDQSRWKMGCILAKGQVRCWCINKNSLIKFDSQQPPQMPGKPKLLLIEDSEILSYTLTEMLNQAFEVSSTNSAKKALTNISRIQPDIVLLDIMVEGPINGFMLLEKMKSMDELENTPVVMMSSIDDENKITKALEIGATDYIVKPFNFIHLFLKLKNLVSLKSKTVLDTQEKLLMKSDSTLNSMQLEFKKKFEKITDNLISTNDFSIREIAASLSMSVSTVERWSKKIYGLTPKEYIIDRKLLQAEIMLRQNSGNVKTISYRLGFNSVAYFCKLFKKKFGTSPGQLANKKRLLSEAQTM
jgi:DNA-binding response OmpR family regulator